MRKPKSMMKATTTIPLAAYNNYLNQQRAGTSVRKNTFSALQEMDLDALPKENSKQEYVEKPPKIPPIVIDSSTAFKTVIDFVGDKGYTFKRTSIGTKIFSEDLSKYNDLMIKLRDKLFFYHTHKMKSRNIFNMILSGLHKVDPKEIKTELKDNHGIECVNVKEIITSRSSASDALYILSFKHSDVRKKTLFTIKFLLKVGVTWSNPKSKQKNGPTQCDKCGMYGHGSENCYRKKVCFLCSSNTHISDDCGLKKSNSDGKQFKCFNCVSKKYQTVDHRADDPRCPCRRDYLQARQAIAQRNVKPQNQGAMGPVFKFREEDFPVPPRNNQVDPQPSTSRALYSEQLSYRSNDLYTIDELFNIFQHALSDLKKCSSKTEQLFVIMSLLKNAI